MNDINYTITFFSDWHCGSGMTAGPKNDALVRKDQHGLPVVPGKTMKGLLKDAAADLFADDGFIPTCFGNEDEQSGTIFFGPSILSDGLTAYFLEHPKEKGKLYRFLPSIRIDGKTGVAKNKSLRTIEVCIPLTVVGTISDIPEDCKDKMVACLKMVKHIGSGRNRGLGRCEIKINTPEEQKGGAQ